MAYQFAESLGANYSFLSILNTQWQDCSWGVGGGGRKENDITGAFFMKKKTYYMLSNPPIPYEIFALASHFHVYLPWVNICSEKCLNSVLNVNALVGTLKQEPSPLLQTFVWTFA